MSVTATFRRLSGKHNRLANAAQAVVDETTKAMNKRVLDALGIMNSEPPLKVGSRYVRTHTYSRSWRPIFARASGGRLQAGIGGNAIDPRGHNYTVAVGGDSRGEGQIEMHETTGWPVAKEALEGKATGQNLSSFRTDIAEAMHRAFRKNLGS